MPEMKKGLEIGIKSRNNYIWLACTNCGLERWVPLTITKKSSFSGLCHHCNSCCRREYKHWRWKGGKFYDGDGYVLVKLSLNDFFASMASRLRCKSGGYVAEHRLIVARHLGRCLHRWEIVHHKNHIRDDNRIENLQLVTDDRHKQITILENRINILEKRITLLEAENILLKEEVQIT